MQFNIKKVLKIIPEKTIESQVNENFIKGNDREKEFFTEKCSLKVAKHKKTCYIN